MSAELTDGLMAVVTVATSAAKSVWTKAALTVWKKAGMMVDCWVVTKGVPLAAMKASEMAVLLVGYWAGQMAVLKVEKMVDQSEPENRRKQLQTRTSARDTAYMQWRLQGNKCWQHTANNSSLRNNTQEKPSRMQSSPH